MTDHTTAESSQSTQKCVSDNAYIRDESESRLQRPDSESDYTSADDTHSGSEETDASVGSRWTRLERCEQNRLGRREDSELEINVSISALWKCTFPLTSEAKVSPRQEAK